VAGVSAPLRVVIVDDDALVRSALGMILRSDPGIELVGEAEDGAAGLELISAVAPDVVLMDIRMPRMDGLEALRQLAGRSGAPKVIVLTTFDDDDHVVRALRDGASGFLLKHTPPTEIVDSVHKVAAGDHMLSPSVTAQLIARLGTEEPESERVAHARSVTSLLTEREREVAIAVAEGKVNADIAAELYLSVATIKAHVSRLMTKLEATNRVQLAVRVRDAGLL